MKYLYSHKSLSQCINKGSTSQLLHVFFCLVKTSLRWLWRRRRTFHQLHKVMAPGDVHDAKHAFAVVTNPLHVAASARQWLSWRRKAGEREDSSVKNKLLPVCNQNTSCQGIFHDCIWKVNSIRDCLLHLSSITFSRLLLQRNPWVELTLFRSTRKANLESMQK